IEAVTEGLEVSVPDPHLVGSSAYRKSPRAPEQAVDADRDRGTPRDVTPPTPPGIRVRTTAVRPGEPSLRPEIGQSQRIGVSAGEARAERGGESYPPRPAIAASREPGVLPVDAALP